MLPNLEPNVSAEQLPASPLSSMLAQLRYSPPRQFDEKAIGQLHGALISTYPRRLQEQQVELIVTPGGVQTTPTPVWRLTNLDRTASVVLGPGQITFESSEYTVWKDFAERLSAGLEALVDVCTVLVRERVGLRYVNEVRPEGDGEPNWSNLIAPPILGPVGRLETAGHLVHALSELRLRDKQGIVNLRYGLNTEVPPPQQAHFLLDIDCFEDQPAVFDLTETLELFNTYNDTAFRLFRWCLTDSYYAQIRGDSNDAAGVRAT